MLGMFGLGFNRGGWHGMMDGWQAWQSGYTITLQTGPEKLVTGQEKWVTGPNMVEISFKDFVC